MKTALITGASSGIGLELAKLFAEAKTNLVLVARREDRLNELAKRLESAFNIKALVIPKDLSVSTAVDEIFSCLKEKNIAIDYLVNDAGCIVYGEFSKNSLDDELGMIEVNLIALTKLTKLFLPKMLARNSGKILNLGSIGSFVPGPLNAIYCATKGYVLSFSEAISEEVAGTGVTVTALCPGATRTEFAKKGHIEGTLVHKLGTMSAASVARVGYKSLMEGKRVVIPGFFNRLEIFLVRFSPRLIVSKFSKMLMTQKKNH